jgi:small subunit ribosomal protein S4e
MPVHWPVSRKQETFIVKPMPGPHASDNCIPLQVILRDVLKVADTSREAKMILNGSKVLVDKKPRKEPKYPVGLMDVVETLDDKKAYRVNINRSGLFLDKIVPESAGRKLCKITGKTTLKGGLQQISFHDGRNIVVKKDDYKRGDSVLMSLPDQKILKHFKLAKGEQATVIAGTNVGVKGKIKEIVKRKTMLEKSTVTIQSGEKELETLLDYVMVGEV